MLDRLTIFLEEQMIVIDLRRRASIPEADRVRAPTAPYHLDMRVGIGVCVSNVRVVPPSRSSMSRAWL